MMPGGENPFLVEAGLQVLRRRFPGLPVLIYPVPVQGPGARTDRFRVPGVGAPDDDDNGSLSGSAYVYRFNGGGWSQEAKLLASDRANTDHFGIAVAIDGDVAVVGADQVDDLLTPVGRVVRDLHEATGERIEAG